MREIRLTQAEKDRLIEQHDKETCEKCGHYLKADDKRYAQCMDCGHPVPESKRGTFKGKATPWESRG